MIVVVIVLRSGRDEHERRRSKTWERLTTDYTDFLGTGRTAFGIQIFAPGGFAVPAAEHLSVIRLVCAICGLFPVSYLR
jgi:hypothetical protein